MHRCRFRLLGKSRSIYTLSSDEGRGLQNDFHIYMLKSSLLLIDESQCRKTQKPDPSS